MPDPELTRRTLIGRGIAAGAAAYAGAALTADPVFALTAGRGPRRAPRRFQLLGIEGDGGGMQARTRLDRGSWGPWLDVPFHADHGPDGGDGGLISDPVWTGPADWFELRGASAGARIHLVAADSGARIAASPPLAEPHLDAGPGQPRIIARRYWADRRCRPRDEPGYGAVEYAAVHHTVNTNFYSRSQAPAIVRSICLYHRNVRGWDDIGYNFLIDRYGRVFEGRAGGIDEPVVGAHAGGFNLYSSGIAMLGTYSSVRPTAAAFRSLVDLVAWKLSLHGVEAVGSTVVRSVYSPTDRYRTGTPVHVRRIQGHRDTGLTSCPGGALYSQLPRLRRLAESAAGPVSSLTATAPRPDVALPAPVAFNGVLTSDGAPVAGAPVELQAKTRTGRATFATATTAEDGTWSTAAELPENTSVRALYRGGGASAVVSRSQPVVVRPQISLAARAEGTVPGGAIEFYGGVHPVKPSVTLIVSRHRPDGTLQEIEARRVRIGDDGLFSAVLGFAEPGDYEVIAHSAADDKNGTGTSNVVRVFAA